MADMTSSTPHPAGAPPTGSPPPGGRTKTTLFRRGARGLLALLILGTSLLVGLGAAPASAAPAPFPTTPGGRCFLNSDPDAFTVFHMDGGRGKTFPPVGWPALRPGDMIRVEPNPTDEVHIQLSTAADGLDYVTPAGDSLGRRAPAPPTDWPGPSLTQYSLLGWVDNQPRREVGAVSCFVATANNSKLTLAINDPQTWDNSGAWNVVLKLYRNPLLDGGFEGQPSRTVSTPWRTEGPEPNKGIDIGLGFQHTGRSNAFIRTSSCTWNALTQSIPVKPNTAYVLRGFVRTLPTDGRTGLVGVNTAFIGVRPGDSLTPQDERHFGPSPPGLYEEINVPFNSRNNVKMTVFVGFWGLCRDSWIQIDDLTVLST